MKKSDHNQGQMCLNVTLSSQEKLILRQIILWEDEYTAALKASNPPYFHLKPRTTTDVCSKHFKYEHKKMLALLNRLEKDGLIRKRRRRSAGFSGNGFAGSLHAEVTPTQKGREALAYK